VETILPPVDLPYSSQEAITTFASLNNLDSRSPVIGMASRFASEKGVEILLDALPRILESHPNAMILYAGQYEDVLGEEEYAQRLFSIIKKYQARGQWKFVGVLSPTEMASFYPNLDVLVVPSLNSTESFGLVQIEAMINGVPVVASDLPGVRQPVGITGMGRIFPVGDSQGLASALISLFEQPSKYVSDQDEVAKKFTSDAAAVAYEDLYRRIKSEL
jgi:glycosyltransferase involved in cell wall biosynthesis